MNEVQIYALCEPNTHVVRFVGRSKDANLNLKNWKRLACRGWIEQLRADGREPELRILEVVESNMADQQKRLWIAEHFSTVLNRRGLSSTQPRHRRRSIKFAFIERYAVQADLEATETVEDRSRRLLDAELADLQRGKRV